MIARNLLFILFAFIGFVTASPLKWGTHKTPTRSQSLNETLPVTNAERLKRGLPIKAPTRLHDAARKRDPLPSTPVTSKNYIKAFLSNGNYWKFLDNENSPFPGYNNWVAAASATYFEYSPAGNPGEIRNPAGNWYGGIQYQSTGSTYSLAFTKTSDGGDPVGNSQVIKTSVFYYTDVPGTVSLIYKDASYPSGLNMQLWNQNDSPHPPTLAVNAPATDSNGEWTAMTLYFVDTAVDDNSHP